MFRVWTKNFDDTVTCMTGFISYNTCKRFIIGRWRHWPPWAYISKAKSSEMFLRYNQKQGGVTMKQVELISTGYEWICPGCDELKHEIELNEEVYCPDCDEYFQVSEYYHAFKC